MKNDLYLSADQTKIMETHIVYECEYDEDGNEVNTNKYPVTNTFAKVTHVETARAMHYIEQMLEYCTLDELIAVAAYAKQCANTKLNAMKKYL